MRGGDAGGLAAGDASRATGTSVATVTTSLAAVELCDEDVAMRCSAQSDAGSAADPEWEAVLAQLLAEEAEEEELCCRFERRGDDSDCLPRWVGLREHMQARAAVRYKVGLALLPWQCR